MAVGLYSGNGPCSVVAGASLSAQVADSADAVRRLQVEKRSLGARLDGGGGGVNKRVGKLREFSVAASEFSDWPFKVKCHSSLAGQGSVVALEWAGRRLRET